MRRNGCAFIKCWCVPHVCILAATIASSSVVVSLYRYFSPAPRQDAADTPMKCQCIQSDLPSPEQDPDSEADETAPSDTLSRTETVLELISCLSSSTSSKQSWRFNPDWLLERQHWLEYAGGKGMFCTLCRKYNKRLFNRDILEYPAMHPIEAAKCRLS